MKNAIATLALLILVFVSPAFSQDPTFDAAMIAARAKSGREAAIAYPDLLDENSEMSKMVFKLLTEAFNNPQSPNHERYYKADAPRYFADLAALALGKPVVASITPAAVPDATPAPAAVVQTTPAPPQQSGGGLVQPTYGSPKYNVEIKHADWIVEVGEVYIVDGTDKDLPGNFIIHMGGIFASVPQDAISLVPPDNKDYAKASKIYADCVRQSQAQAASDDNQRRADDLQRQIDNNQSQQNQQNFNQRMHDLNRSMGMPP